MSINKIIILLITISIGSCRDNVSKKTSFSAMDVYKLMIQNLDSLFPGRGKDVFNDEIKDRCMAYGLILSSEVNRYNYTKDTTALWTLKRSGQWLIENSDLNKDGIHGYGLADSFDAFGDSTTNPQNQEYAITTGIVINGLLDWYEIEDDSLYRIKIKNVISKCIIPYLDSNYYTGRGLPMYSLNPNDKFYDVFNSSVYLTGQMKRFIAIAESDTLKNI
jgi:hypothetical protein